jgi:hypothetical protein
MVYFAGKTENLIDSVFGKFVQSDQKENKSEQALQITDHVVAEFYANTVKAPMSGHRRSPIFCPFNRDVRAKEIHLVQRKKKICRP